MTTNKLVTKREAADILGLDPSGVHRIMRDYGLEPAERIGGSERPALLLFRRSEVERIARQRAKAAS